MRDTDSPQWLNTCNLMEPLGLLHGNDVDSVDDWTCSPIAGGAGEAIGVYRVTGSAAIDGADTPFSVILKGWSPPNATVDTASWDWSQRERLAYASGVLDNLPGGIHAPRCLGMMTGPDGSEWVWLSSMSEGATASWNLEHFASVARHLGRFNGAYLTDNPVPDAQWLSHQWTRRWTEAAGDAIAVIDHYSSHPLYSSVFPPAAVRAIHAIWAERHAWLDCIEALPQTFSHLDAFTRNIFLRPGPDDDLAVGLIDWGFSGVAAVGEEIAPLVAASIAFSDLAHIAPDALDRAVFAGYLEGLRDAGWTGDEVLVRAAYTGSIALRYGVGPQRAFLPMLLDERYHPFLEELFGVPIADFGKRYASRGEWIVGLADEFRLLLPSLEPTMPGAA